MAKDALKVIYIAGPYRSDCEWGVINNIRHAEAAAIFVWQHGGAALCPHKNTAFFGGVPGCPDHVWIAGDCAMLIRCDAVYAIRGWAESTGAKSEVEIARMNKIPVLFTENEVIRFIENE